MSSALVLSFRLDLIRASNNIKTMFMKNLLSTAAILIISLFLLKSCDFPKITPKGFPPPKPCPGVAQVEYAGEVYPTVQVGNQCWLAKNLNIGKRISHLENPKNNDTIEKFCVENIESNCDKYGGLYMWDEMMRYTDEEGAQGICPDGWHIPTNDEFVELYFYVDGLTLYLYDTSYSDKEYCNNCVGRTGFNLLSGKILHTDRVYSFDDPLHYSENSTGFFTSNHYMVKFSYTGFLLTFLEEPESTAYYIRCIKDED
jgi:uncharacterized protein (TIGR02145 family)